MIQEDTLQFNSNEEARNYIAKHYRDYQKQEEIKIKGIIGFIRFIQGYYLYYFKRTNTVAKLGSKQ